MHNIGRHIGSAARLLAVVVIGVVFAAAPVLQAMPIPPACTADSEVCGCGCNCCKAPEPAAGEHCPADKPDGCECSLDAPRAPLDVPVESQQPSHQSVDQNASAGASPLVDFVREFAPDRSGPPRAPTGSSRPLYLLNTSFLI
jgi:hypothetical protein